MRDMLLQRSMKVQLWGVDSEGGGSKANPTLQLERSASPGQLADFEDELAGAQSAQGGAGQRDPSVLAALQLRTAAAAGNEVGLAFADSSGERVLHVCQFADEDDFAREWKTPWSGYTIRGLFLDLSGCVPKHLWGGPFTRRNMCRFCQSLARNCGSNGRSLP